MKNIIISTVALAMFSIGDLAAQAQNRRFSVIDHMHIPEGKSADDYIAVEKLWQRVHQNNVDAGICLNWALYKVENGGRTDFVTVQTYDSLDKSTTPNGLKSLPKGFFNSDEEKVMEGTWASRERIFSEVTERVTSVGATGQVDLGLVGVMHYMKGKPGKDALDIEKTIYSKIQAVNVKNGSMQKWFVNSRMYPSGSDMAWNYSTGNWYTKEQMGKTWDGAGWQKTVETALGKEEAAKLPDVSTWRTCVRKEIWYPILTTTPLVKKYTLKDLSRYEGVWKGEFKNRQGEPRLIYFQNRIDTNTALMRNWQLSLDPDSREVKRSGTGWTGLSPSGENFHSLGFGSSGQVFETGKTPKGGKFAISGMGTRTDGSHLFFTRVEEFLSDTELRVTDMNVTTNGTFTEQVREGTFKKTNRSSIEDLVQHKEVVFGNWNKNQPISQLAPMKRLLGHWQVKDSNGKEELNCHFRYVGDGKWMVEYWNFAGGGAGVNVSGVDPLTGELALWSVGKNFMGKNGRWDELDKNVLGQVQGSARLVREFPDAKTYKAHWQGLTKGSYVDSREKGYTATFVEKSKNASQNAATATALPSSWKQFVELFVKQGGLGTWTSKSVTAEMWVGIPAGLEYTGSGTSEIAKDGNAIFDSGNMLLKDGRTLSIGTSLTTWDAETGKVVFCNSGFDTGKPYNGIGTLKAIDGSSITWEYVENSRGQTTTYETKTRQVDSNNRVVTMQKLPDGKVNTVAEVRK